VATKGMISSKNDTASQAYSSDDARKVVYTKKYTQHEIVLRQLAIRLGMTREDMYYYLGLK